MKALLPDTAEGRSRRHRRHPEHTRLRVGVRVRDLGEWLISPQTINAYYSPAQHEVVVSAGILQPPYFNAEEDDAVNYGAIGAVIGHEVSHALDLRDFDAGTRALTAQASAHQVLPGLQVNGPMAQSETLADLSGLAIAHRADRRSLKGRPAPVIGGLAADERFFLAWARIWRVQSRPEYVRSQAAISRYAPWEFRANGLVQHLDAFHGAFNVKPGDRLYREPSARLKIW
jgi:putative endopeptidase